MKIKDLEKTVNIAWSPRTQHPVHLAVGTAAQQFDASFSTAASLEVYSLNLGDPSMDLGKVASVSCDNRFYKLVWGAEPDSIIVGGCDGGLLQIYDSRKLTLLSKQEKHTGPVTSLDFNPFQNNLLASGASDSEIYIWDLNNVGTPMTPGNKSQPLENIQCLSWNRQVQHILATTFSTRCVVWDLRKNEPIIKLTDAAAHVRWKSVCWHPEVATQLCLASEDDQSPVIQLWDLRFATSPLKVLDNHQRGVLAVDWCPSDCDLLISCAKDNRILCWNPNSTESRGEVLAEVAQTLQWNFDISWCPRNPAVFAAASFDGHVSIYSLMGGKQQQVQTSNKIADSFPGMDGYVQAPPPQQAPPVSVDLSKAPKWLKRPVGASFAFGGKLLTFEPETPRSIRVSQVITEPELIQAANHLEEALQVGNFLEYCREKADASTDQHERYVWHFLKANFTENPKMELLNLLGFNQEDVNTALAKKTQHLSNEHERAFDNMTISDGNVRKVPFKIQTGDDTDGLITQAILVGNIETAVDLCIASDRMADALIIAMTGGADLLARTQHRYLQKSTGYVSSLISALVSENWSDVVSECSVDSWREAMAALLTYSSGDELHQLCEKLGERLEREQKVEDAQLCYISAGAFNKLVSSWEVKASPKGLQDLVELVTFMQKAMEHQGRQVEISGTLADLLSNYAILLASQGSLTNALNYLGTSSIDSHLVELRQRLHYNLGLREQPARPPSASAPRKQYILDPSVQNPYGGMRPSPAGPPSAPQVPLLNPAKVSSMPQGTIFGGAPPPVYNINAVPSTPPLMPPKPPQMDLVHPMMHHAPPGPPGWNDPPVVSKTLRQQPKSDLVTPSPITHPLFGAGEVQNHQNQLQNQLQNHQNQLQNQLQNQPPQNGMPQQFIPQFIPPPLPQHQHPPKTTPPAPQIVQKAQEVVTKDPLPEEHMYLQTVFNELQVQCACAANNPQTKRKLEDVSRKLETLYDLLRSHKLSSQTLNGLHQMVQFVQIGDYTNGLGLHTQLVSGPDFSQIASFMPGLKVLLQCALQLQVYLR